MNSINNLKFPIDYFKYFFSEEILQLIVDQSNLYAIQHDPSKPLDLTLLELEQWLGICIYFSLSKLSNTRQHWSSSINLSPITSIMSRNRWELIKSKFHLVNNDDVVNSSDKMIKVRPLVDHLRSKFNKIEMEKYLSVDEQLIPFKGTTSMKQYIPSKPHKWGFKYFLLAGKSGIIYDFIPYTGKITSDPNEPDLGASSNIVMQIARIVPTNSNHVLTFDNWFTSLPLLAYMGQSGIKCTGTIRSNRLPGLKLKCDKHLQDTGRGSYDEWETNIDEIKIHVVKWFDNRSVCLASSFVQATPIDTCKRYDKKKNKIINIPCPQIIKTYNSTMGGVDLVDCMIALYMISIKFKKYYHRLVFHMIDMALLNSWLFYRIDFDRLLIPYRQQNNFCTFKSKFSNSLCFTNKNLPKKEDHQMILRKILVLKK